MPLKNAPMIVRHTSITPLYPEELERNQIVEQYKRPERGYRYLSSPKRSGELTIALVLELVIFEVVDLVSFLVGDGPPAEADHEPAGDVLDAPEVNDDQDADEQEDHHAVVVAGEQVHERLQQLERAVERRRLRP